MIRALGQSLVTIFGQDLAVDPSITGMREEVGLSAQTDAKAIHRGQASGMEIAY